MTTNPQPQPSVLSESELAEIEGLAQGNVKDPATYMFLLSRVFALCATVRALRAELSCYCRCHVRITVKQQICGHCDTPERRREWE